MLKAGIFVLVLAGLSACNLSSSYKNTTPGNQIAVLMHDTPGVYDALVLNVKKVEIHSTDNSAGWVTINKQAFSVDVRSLVNGNYAVIGSANGLASGTYNQLRITLDTGNKISVDGTVHDLSIDTTTAQSGINVTINSQIDAQNNSTVMLDFDVSRSVAMNQSDSTYTLKPRVSASELTNTGAITGTINPLIAQPVIYAVNGADTVTSTYAALATGQFTFIALKAGTYDLIIHPLAGSYKDTTLTNVSVTSQKNNSLSPVTLSQK